MVKSSTDSSKIMHFASCMRIWLLKRLLETHQETLPVPQHHLNPHKIRRHTESCDDLREVTIPAASLQKFCVPISSSLNAISSSPDYKASLWSLARSRYLQKDYPRLQEPNYSHLRCSWRTDNPYQQRTDTFSILQFSLNYPLSGTFWPNLPLHQCLLFDNHSLGSSRWS